MAPNPLVAVRLPPDLLARLDRYVAQLNEEHPGLDHGRGEAIKVILARNLPPLDEPAPSTPAEKETGSAKPSKPRAKRTQGK
jgi:hypothetical protein